MSHTKITSPEHALSSGEVVSRIRRATSRGYVVDTVSAEYEDGDGRSVSGWFTRIGSTKEGGPSSNGLGATKEASATAAFEALGFVNLVRLFPSYP